MDVVDGPHGPVADHLAAIGDEASFVLTSGDLVADVNLVDANGEMPAGGFDLASLRLRRGDVTVAEVYEQHGRLHCGTVNQMERASVAAWWERRQAGNKGLLMSPTNEAVERLNQRCQQTRVNAGEIDPSSRHITVGVYTVHAGDEVATRQNERRLTTDRGEMVRNRAVWTVDHIHPDGSLTATGKHGTVRLPAPYVAEHVELAYARTVMGAQGRNVQGGASFYEKPTDVRNLYVAMTRGTAMNEAFMVVNGEQTAADVFAQSIATDWIDLPAHARRAELRDEKPHRPGLLDGRQLRELLEQRFDVASTIENAENTLRRIPAERQQAERAKTAAEKTITEKTAAYHVAEDVLANYDRPLHRRKHATEIDDARLDIQRLPAAVKTADNELHVAVGKLERLRQLEAQAKATLRHRPDVEAKIDEIDGRLDHDLRVRTRITRLEPPDAIVNTIGDRPAPGPAARQWDAAAGRLAQHQAAFDITDGLGRRPRALERNAYIASREDVEDLISPLVQPTPGRRMQIESRGIEL